MSHQILLNPGPVNVSERVRQALLMPDICHREEEFSRLLQQVRQKILKVLQLDDRIYSTTVLTGSGTAALEAGVIGAYYAGQTSCSERSRTTSRLRSTSKLLVLSNGIYAERIAEIAQRHRIPTLGLRFPYNQRFDLDKVDETLRKNRPVSVVAMTHHETSTGMLNPTDEIGKIVKRHGKIFAIDAISSLGADSLEIGRDGIDFCIGSAGKCFHAFPGLSFVVSRRALLKKLSKIKVSSLYFDLGNSWNLQEKGDVPFTPAVQLFSAFNAALDEFLQQTLQGRIQIYTHRANLLRDGFEKLGLEYLLPRLFYSNTLTSLMLPKGFTYKKLHDRLKKREGFVIYAGQAQFSRKIFRIAHMGEISDSKLNRLLKRLAQFRTVYPLITPTGRIRATRRAMPAE